MAEDAVCKLGSLRSIGELFRTIARSRQAHSPVSQDQQNRRCENQAGRLGKGRASANRDARRHRQRHHEIWRRVGDLSPSATGGTGP